MSKPYWPIIRWRILKADNAKYKEALEKIQKESEQINTQGTNFAKVSRIYGLATKALESNNGNPKNT